MPIGNGKYEAKILTVYKSAKEGIDAIKGKIENARKVKISNIPMSLLKELLVLLDGKDVKMILPANEEPTEELRKIGNVAIQKAKIYKDYKGVEAFAGSIYLSDVVFGVTWTGENILQIDAMNYNKCVKCMKGFFDTGWRYADKRD